MKIKLIWILTLVPMLSMAHSGHQHQASEIIFSPIMWLDHLLFIVFVGVLIIGFSRIIMKKYYPGTFKLYDQKTDLK